VPIGLRKRLRTAAWTVCSSKAALRAEDLFALSRRPRGRWPLQAVTSDRTVGLHLCRRKQGGVVALGQMAKWCLGKEIGCQRNLAHAEKPGGS
jgi:hypothetical protein